MRVARQSTYWTVRHQATCFSRLTFATRLAHQDFAELQPKMTWIIEWCLAARQEQKR